MTTSTGAPTAALASETSPLCNTCLTIGAWGPEGWKDFYNRTTHRRTGKFQRENRSLLRSVCYDVDVEQFYADVEHCAWCAALQADADLPPDLRTAQKQCGFKEYDINVEFFAPDAVVPVRINRISVMVAVRDEGGYLFFYGRFGIFARPDSIASRVFFSPRQTSYQASQFNDELARSWIEKSTPQRRINMTSIKRPGERGAIQYDDKSQRTHPEPLPLLPTRVLDITPSAHGSEHPAIVLRETSPGERGEYICLSYTWGLQRRHDFPQLARDLLRHHRDAPGPLSPLLPALPVAFIDAAHVALKLGIKHLWIDALCVWQDDQDDLNAELSQMHRYFSEATVVVQTSGTRSVDEPFLGEARNSELGDMLHAAALGSGGAAEEDFLKITYHHEHYQRQNGVNGQQASECWGEILSPEDDDTTAALSSLQQQNMTDIVYLMPTRRLPVPYHPAIEPSASRGWIFQEQNLCRRLLVFPSGGGMLFTTNDPYPADYHPGFSPLSSSAVVQDGQVNHFISPKFTSGGQNRRSSGLPTWGRQKLMDPRTDFRKGILYMPWDDRMLVRIDQMRRLYEMGNEVDLEIFNESGHISLNVGPRPKMPRNGQVDGCGELEAEGRNEDRSRRNKGSMEELDDIGGVSDVGVVTSDEDEDGGPEHVTQQLKHFTLEEKDVPGSTADDRSLSQWDYLQRPESHNEGTQATSNKTDDDNDDDDNQLQSRTSRNRRASKTVLEPMELEIVIPCADGTSSTIIIPPTQHPLLDVTCGPDIAVVATGPWPGSIFASQLPEVWNHLVSDYCVRRLTHPRDKLVAMAALSSAFLDKYGPDVLGDYHAGVWAKFAGEGLLWYSTWRETDQRRRERLVISDRARGVGADDRAGRLVDYDDRAPSWSWASVSSAQYPDPKMDIELGVDYMPLDLTVLSVATQAAEDSPPNGAVLEGGSVRVRGLVMDVWWGMDVNRYREEVVNLFVAETGEQRVGKYGNACPDHGWLYPPESGEREEVLLLLGRRFVQGVGHNDDHEGECLLLRRREGLAGTEEAYVRVGFAGPVFFNFEKEWRSRFREVELTIY